MPFKKRSFVEHHTPTTLMDKAMGRGGGICSTVSKAYPLLDPGSDTLAHLLLDWDGTV